MPPLPRVVRVRVCVLLSDERGVLMVRHEKQGRSYWLLPGGGLEYGETLEEAARREVREETGLDVRVGSLALLWETLAPDGSRHVVNLCFAAHLLQGDPHVTGADARVREASFVPLEALSNLPMHPALAGPIGVWLKDGPSPLVLGPQWSDENGEEPEGPTSRLCETGC